MDFYWEGSSYDSLNFFSDTLSLSKADCEYENKTEVTDAKNVKILNVNDQLVLVLQFS